MSVEPVRFIGEQVEVAFDEPPLLEKKPSCPDRFVWGEHTHEITAVISEWIDFERRGRMARTMRPTNVAKAAQRGSWGS